MQVPVRFGHKLLNRLSLNGIEAIKMVDIQKLWICSIGICPLKFNPKEYP